MVEYLNHVVLQQFKNWMLPIAMIVGGAIVCGAAIYFGSLDTSWSGAAATMTNTIYVDAAPASWTADASSFHLIA